MNHKNDVENFVIDINNSEKYLMRNPALFDKIKVMALSVELYISFVIFHRNMLYYFQD
jgi:hypothetical protein